MNIEIPDAGLIINTFLRTSFIFTFTFILIRLLGKKRVSQFSIFDLLLVISLGSAVGDAMIYTEKSAPMVVSLIAILTVVMLIKLYDKIVDRMPGIQAAFEGSPTVIIANGRINQEALHREKLTKKNFYHC
jgi:uncharacterized membrane protein YcaP (DUF421 family)